MTQNRKRCVEEIDLGQAGSPIWKLIRASIPLIQSRLNWDLGNGKDIKIWEDNYSKSGILSKNPALNQLKHWLSSEGRFTLYNISNWHPNGNWKNWNLGEATPPLKEEANMFLQAISGSAPVCLSKKDNRSWEKEGYTVHLGYKHLIENNDIPTKSAIWKEIGNPNSLPKINILCWQLAHNKLLTGENLNKRGFLGPFRCALCANSLETSDHLFLHCNFSRQVINNVYLELVPNMSKPTSTRSLICKWAKHYKGSIQGNTKLSRAWKASIKFVCWQIWLARNKRIFKEKTTSPQEVTIKAIGQLSEFLLTKKPLTLTGVLMRS
jgi:hypothetical protein